MHIDEESMFPRWADKVLIGDDCWEWTASKSPRGYGYIGSYPRGRTELAHRVAYQLMSGPIPDGMCVCHHCDNPSCVKPSHLFIGTHSDNMRDKVAKGRANCVGRPGESNPLARLTYADVDDIRSRIGRGERGVDIAAAYGVSKMCISDIKLGKRWAAAQQSAY